MMKRLILSFLFATSLSCMTAQLKIGAERNIKVYLPLTETAQKYDFNENDLSTSAFSINTNYEFSISQNFIFSLGLNYKYCTFNVDNIIKEIEYKEYNSSSGNLIDSGYFVTNVGYYTTSQSFGFNFHLIYNIFENKYLKHQVGVTSTCYIKELFDMGYNDDVLKNAPLDQWYNEYSYRIPSLGIYGARNGFYFSSLNLSTYYRFVFQLHEKFSLAARVSLGANLYSDWDQFKKYAWLGLGLELGFGKVKEKKKKD